MKLHAQPVCQLAALLSLFCVLITVRESESTFVPGRCACPRTQQGVRGQLKQLLVIPRKPGCDKVTVIVTMKNNDQQVCLDPEAPMGRQLIRCWNRVHLLGHDVTVCLKRQRRRRGQCQRKGPQSQQRRQAQSQKVLSSNSQ